MINGSIEWYVSIQTNIIQTYKEMKKNEVLIHDTPVYKRDTNQNNT
jgi:hypothetical protein